MSVIERPRWLRNASSALAVRVGVLAFLFNWAWEAVHAAAFVESTGTLAFRFWHCLPMAVTDAGWTLALWLLVGGLAHASKRTPPWRLVALGMLGAITAVAVERSALATGRWTYNSLMPILPFVHVGLWPVLQMTLLPILTGWLSDRLRR